MVGVASKRQVRWGLVSLFYKSSLRLNVGNIHGTCPRLLRYNDAQVPLPTNRSKRSDSAVRLRERKKKKKKPSPQMRPAVLSANGTV